ncbi:hypothetical protein EMIHUDRAFT_198018 [Emiliania huxleyi CCMP1516]|uniref:Uncharacterized protein n=2 Tax=Emiliania huxleyi TaxID=2903 RepID=A0A0D3IE49_EMIH1|nr:hypothetical protein EMIHUDRAFT_198018 [Emiliania huxleyi CCMP1516]EOD09534.1 hypothetical protein EMIHUDRAFT_198018 [Emiliania huxleyi CCMP1516]|eukprot:XP_005761963.1 hypothetical protein EMIHUDRAFT_198018 [Emiliania huxleyi CCMP1516]
MRAALNGRGNAKVVRLGCSPSCREGRLCHGDSLAAMARELIGVRDERRREGQQRGDAPKPRKPRADKGVPRGPRALKGTTAYQIGHLSLLRFRHGHERQVSQRTLDAVREAQGAGVEPWNTAEHDKAVHGPTPEGGTTNPMESEPPASETYDDEGDDERDKSAAADDEMAFIDDEFFELPDAATEGEAEGGGSQSQYSQQSQGGESEGSQSSQGSRRTAHRRSRTNRQAAERFMDRLRFELLQGGSGGDGHRHPEDANDGDEDGERSEDEEMPDRTTEPGPSEQPPETSHPNEGSQTDDEFTVMDVEEEQPEDEAPQPPRKRGRFENERSDSMSQGGGASQQHHEGEEPMTKTQRQRQRQRKQGSHRKPPVKFRR